MAKIDSNIEVRIVGKNISPATIPLRLMSRTLSAIQDIASGRDPAEERHVPKDKVIGVVRIKKGSAVYECVASAPKLARENLETVGRLLANPEDKEISQRIVFGSLSKLSVLGNIAKRTKCEIQIDWVNGRKKRLLTIGAEDYDNLSSRIFVKGESLVQGIVQRVGGATDTRCQLRIPERSRLLYCDIARKDLARAIGEHLYKPIAATGTATWIARTWEIFHFKIRDFTCPTITNTSTMLEDLRDAGLSAWDDIKDPTDYIRKLRR